METKLFIESVTIISVYLSFQPGAPKFPPKTYIVDLIHDPGTLMRFDTPEAQTYQKI